jgi:hypothetical protein
VARRPKTSPVAANHHHVIDVWAISVSWWLEISTARPSAAMERSRSRSYRMPWGSRLEYEI